MTHLCAGEGGASRHAPPCNMRSRRGSPTRRAPAPSHRPVAVCQGYSQPPGNNGWTGLVDHISWAVFVGSNMQCAGRALDAIAARTGDEQSKAQAAKALHALDSLVSSSVGAQVVSTRAACRLSRLLVTVCASSA